jgi:hypothetical protein
MFCQEPVSKRDGGVVRIEPAEQYIVGSIELCTPRTVLSPDRSTLQELTASAAVVHPAAPLAPVEEGGVRESTLVAPRPIAAVPQCKATYRAKMIDLMFPKDGDGLTPEGKAVLTGLLAEGPNGLSVIGFLPSGAHKKAVETVRHRMASVREHSEKLLAQLPSITQEERVLSKDAARSELAQTIHVIGMFMNPCGERVLVRRPAPPGAVPAGIKVDSQGGAPVAR